MSVQLMTHVLENRWPALSRALSGHVRNSVWGTVEYLFYPVLLLLLTKPTVRMMSGVE